MPTTRTVHTWTVKDREYLVLLKLKYARKCIAPVFNQLLARTLVREGLTEGISAPALDAQYQEMRVGGKGYDIYAEMAALSEIRLDMEYRLQIREIEAAARAIPLILVRANNRSRRTSHQLSRIKRVRTIRNRATRRSISRSSSLELFTSERILTVRQRNFADKISPFFANNTSAKAIDASSEVAFTVSNSDIIPPSLTIDYDFIGNKSQKRPLLLFRCDENPTTFRARRYRDPVVPVPKPDAFGSKDYRGPAMAHLERDDSYLSPFMSFAQRPRNSIRRVEIARSENFDKKRFLAIFSFNDIEENAAQNFGEGAGPHLVRALFEGRFSDLPDGYTGSGEWLVHGFVDCEPLTVLDATQVVKLARAARSFSTGDITALTDVRSCLRDVPLRWRQAVAYVILRNYCGRKLPEIDTPAYDQMMQVVVGGYIRSTTDLADFSRLSVADSDSEYDHQSESDNDDLAETTTPRQRLMDHHNTEKTSLSVNNVSQEFSQTNIELPLPIDSAVNNLNSFRSTAITNNRRDEDAESTPLWSPDPSKGPGPSQIVPDAHSAQPIILEELVRTTSIYEDSEWDFVNDELEASFLTSFPSTAKRTHNLQVASTALNATFTGFDNQEEEEEENYESTELDTEQNCFIIPSIEVDRSQDALTSRDRDNFLRGLTAHAIRNTSESSIVETPNKAPRVVTNTRSNQNGRKEALLETTDEPTTAIRSLTSIFSPNSPLRSRNDKMPQPPKLGRKNSRPIDITRIDPFTAQGALTNTTTSVDRRMHNHKAGPQPNTTIRTKVPVIVRKTLVDS